MTQGVFKHERDDENQLRQLLDNVGQVFWLMAAKPYRTLYVSQAYERIWGRPRAALYESPWVWVDAIHAEDREGVIAHMHERLAPEQPFEMDFRIHRPDGSVRYIHDRIVPIAGNDGTIDRYAGVAEDITERREVESAFREIEKLLRSVFQDSVIGQAVVSPGGRWLRVNPAFCHIVGRSEAELLATDFQSITHPDDLAQDMAWVEAVASGDDTPFSHEKRYLRLDSSPVWVHVTGIVQRDASGRPQRYIAQVADVSARKEMESTLRESEMRYRRIVETTDEGVWVIGDDNRTSFVNRQMADMLGYTVTEMHELELFHFMDAEGRKQAENHLARRRAGMTEQHDFRFTRKDGSDLWTFLSTNPIVDDAGNYVGALAMITDITDRKARERQRLVEEVAHRNILVREVHHRIKNNLQGVMGMLRQFAASHPEVAPVLAEAVAQVQSVAVIHGLQGHAPTGRIVLCDLLNSIVANVESLLHTKISMEMASHCDPCLVVADKEAVPMALVLNELIVNAVKHAVPESTVWLEAHIDESVPCAEIRIRNCGTLPPGFNFGDSSDRKGIGNGSGLQLVVSLLPKHGARLTFREYLGEVEACLVLEAPTITAAI